MEESSRRTHLRQSQLSFQQFRTSFCFAYHSHILPLLGELIVITISNVTHNGIIFISLGGGKNVRYVTNGTCVVPVNR